jgi:outer membrane immunogenic protein
MKLFLMSFSISALLTGAAAAADLPVKAPTRAPIAPALWSGCYIGANVGWIKGDDRYTTEMSGGFLEFGSIVNDPTLLPLFVGRHRSDGSGVAGGGQVGCNFQTNSAIVLGVEGDIQLSSLDHSVTDVLPLVPLPSPISVDVPARSVTINQRLDWYSTIRGRLGVTWGQALFYATGGVAFAGLNTTTTVQIATGGQFGGLLFQGSYDRVRVGYAVGGGLEYAFSPAWSLKAEYLYLDFGSYSYEAAETAPIQQPPQSFKTTVHTRDHVARVGLNYRWGH